MLQHLQQNNTFQHSFVQIFDHYRVMCKQCTLSTTEAKQASQELKKSRELVEQLQNQNTNTISPQQIKHLEHRIYSLQEELMTSTRKESETATQLLATKQEVNNLKQELEFKKKFSDDQQNKLADALEKQKQLKQVAEERQQTIDLLRADVVHLKDDIQTHLKKIEDAKKDNEVLIGRTLTEKQKLMDAMVCCKWFIYLFSTGSSEYSVFRSEHKEEGACRIAIQIQGEFIQFTSCYKQYNNNNHQY